MATYGTDLVVLATGSDAESGTWTEFTGWNSGGTPAAETENFIQNTQSYSQTFGNATTGKSICFDAGSDISGSIPAGDVILGWYFMGAGTNLYSYASGGHRFGIGTSTGNFDMWYISGDDRQPNPYGGWANVAVDPRVTADATEGSGSGGAWQFFGSLIGSAALGIRVKISKGNPHAVDGMLMGRGEIYCTGTGATFTLMAADNDAIANRWGLLQDTGGGTFLWKGLMSLGQSGTSATFSDSNKTIVIDDTAKVTSTFNKIELRHASSNITWTNISFASKGTVSKGNLEMVENGTWTMTGCAYNSMGTFTFLSGATVTSCTFNSCDLVTQGGATFDTAIFDSSVGTISMSVDDLSLVTDCTFTSDGSNHAIDLGTITTTQSMSWANYTNNYATANGATGNEAILVSVDSGQTLTINVASGYDTPYYNNTGAGTVSVVSSFTLTLTDIPSGVAMTIVNSSTRTELQHTVSTGVDVTYDHSGGEIVDILFMHNDYDPNAGSIYSLTLPSGNSSIKVNLTDDPNYDNP